MNSIATLLYNHAVKLFRCKSISISCVRVCAKIYLLYFLLYAIIIFSFVVLPMILVVYALLLNQSFSITNGPVYTIISLIPTVVIPFVSWMLKSKVFQFEDVENAQNSEDTNEPRAANNDDDQEEERIPLLTVEENGSSTELARSESSPNLRNRHNYGATNAEDMTSETNC